MNNIFCRDNLFLKFLFSFDTKSSLKVFDAWNCFCFNEKIASLVLNFLLIQFRLLPWWRSEIRQSLEYHKIAILNLCSANPFPFLLHSSVAEGIQWFFSKLFARFYKRLFFIDKNGIELSNLIIWRWHLFIVFEKIVVKTINLWKLTNKSSFLAVYKGFTLSTADKRNMKMIFMKQ